MSSDQRRVKLTPRAKELVEKRFAAGFRWEDLIEGVLLQAGQIIDYTHPYDDRRFIVREISETHVLLDLTPPGTW